MDKLTMSILDEQKCRLISDKPLGDGPLFRDGDKLRLRFDSVVFTNERGGGHLVFRWRGEVVSTRDLSYHFNEGDTLTLDGFEASMQVDIE